MPQVVGTACAPKRSIPYERQSAVFRAVCTAALYRIIFVWVDEINTLYARDNVCYTIVLFVDIILHSILKSFKIIVERKCRLTEFSSSGIDRPHVVCFTAYIASKGKHVITDEREFFVFAKLTMGLQLTPSRSCKIFSNHLHFFQKPLLLKNIWCYYLIFLLWAFNIHLRYLLYLLDFTNGQVSNNLNLLDLFKVYRKLS